MSPNGSFEITQKGWLSLFGQQYLVRGNADGTTMRSLSVGGAERPIDAEARAWIADTIQRLVRNGFGAAARVARGSDYERGRVMSAMLREGALR